MWFATFKDDDKLTHTLKTITTTEKTIILKHDMLQVNKK